MLANISVVYELSNSFYYYIAFKFFKSDVSVAYLIYHFLDYICSCINKVLKEGTLGSPQLLLWDHHLTTRVQNHPLNYFYLWQVI
jgi:hypothetical protein